jgi:transcription elongation factor Elf1
LRCFASQPKLDWNKAIGRLECRVCGASYETTINCEFARDLLTQRFAPRHSPSTAHRRSNVRTHARSFLVADLSEPIDLFSEWIDACEAEQEDAAAADAEATGA